MASLRLKLLTIVLFFSATAIKALRSDGDENAEQIYLDSGGLISRLLAQKIPENYSCNKFPRVCRMKGSPGPDCCKKKCVNVKRDGLNCGMCGRKCRYNEICCKSKCVNVGFDRKNCGGCGIKCKKGDLCAFGICSYA